MTRLLMPTSAVMLATLVLACSDDQATLLMPSAPTGLPGAATTLSESTRPGAMPGGTGLQSPTGLPGAVASSGLDMSPDVMPAVDGTGSPAGRPAASPSWGAVRVPDDLLLRGGVQSPAGRPGAMPLSGGVRSPANLPDALPAKRGIAPVRVPDALLTPGGITPASRFLMDDVMSLDPNSGYNRRNAYNLEIEVSDGEVLVTLIEDDMRSMRESSRPHRMRRIEVGHCPVEPHHIGMMCGSSILTVVDRLAGRLMLTAPLAACDGWIVVQVDELYDDRARGWRNAPCSGIFPDYPADPDPLSVGGRWEGQLDITRTTGYEPCDGLADCSSRLPVVADFRRDGDEVSGYVMTTFSEPPQYRWDVQSGTVSADGTLRLTFDEFVTTIQGTRIRHSLRSWKTRVDTPEIMTGTVTWTWEFSGEAAVNDTCLGARCRGLRRVSGE